MAKRLAGRVNPDVFGALGVLAFVAIAFYGMAGRTGQSWIYPRVLAWVLLAFAALLLARAVLQSERVQMWASSKIFRDVALFVLAVVGYLWLVPRFGFWVPSFLLVATAMTLLGEDRSRKTILFNALGSLALMVVVYLVFFEAFNVRLPSGDWWAPIRP